jgi:RNA polymerase sigma factor (sigma-70 family)
MYDYTSMQIRELAHQLTMSPRRLCLVQIAGIERLLSIVSKKQSYPYELVCFHITGYKKANVQPSRKQASEEWDAISGDVLIKDLLMLAEHISRKAKLTTKEISDASAGTYEDVADSLNVSTKTVRRWRSRGLLGIRAIFDDDVSRLVFLKSSVDLFVKKNKRLVERGASFKQLTDEEKDGIVERAREIIADDRMKLHAVARLIAEETGRAIETVRYTLRRFDESTPEEALFDSNGGPLISQKHLAIRQCRDAGDSIEEIAAALNMTPAKVEQLLREIEARELKDNPVEHVLNELFLAPNADELILESPEPDGESNVKAVRIPPGLPNYLRSLYDVPLLNFEQEQYLFRKYNYLRYKAAKLIDEIEIAGVTKAELGEIRSAIAKADVVRNRLIRSNLRLVVNIAKKHVGWSPRFFEVISDGNMSLMRAVDKFDYSLGNRFSTYGTWAIVKNFARSIPEEHYHTNRYVTGQEELLDASAATEDDTVRQAENQAHLRAAITDSLKNLTDRERIIVTNHFGLGKKKVQTLDQLGAKFGLTKERIRQIEKRAIGKLREFLTPDVAELIPE